MEPTEVAVEIALLKEIAKNTGHIVSDHERRIRKIERWLMYAMGGAAMASLALHFWEVVKH